MLRNNYKSHMAFWRIAVYFSAIIFLIGFLLFSRTYCFENNNKNKIALICLDGATWNIMKPLLGRNELPSLLKLIQNGAHGSLFSEEAFSPPSWTSIATGKNKDKHGIIEFDFKNIPNRKAKYLWRILSDFGIKVGVCNWLMSPCEEINGFIYGSSYLKENPSYLKENSLFYYPFYLNKEIRGDAILEKLPTRDLVEGYKFYGALDRNMNNINIFLINKFQPSFVALGFYATNPYQHRYWSALEPQYFDITDKEVMEKGDLINDHYRKIDNFLNYFIRNNYTVIFVSDHGFCRNDRRSGPRLIKYYNLNSDMQHINFLMNCFLEKLGLLVFIPKLEDGGQIDFSRSQAYYYNNIKKGVSGIKINKKAVKGNEFEKLKKRVYSILKEAHFETGEKAFLDVVENNLDERVDMPDVMFKLSQIFNKENISFKEAQVPYNLTSIHVFKKNGVERRKIIIWDKEYKLEDLINYSRDGVHEHDGVIIMAGKNIKKNVSIDGAHLVDVTPTILYLFGLPVGEDMDGRVLLEAIEPSFIKGHPIKFIKTYEVQNSKRSKIVIGNEMTKEQLRSLGYAQ
ncbi:MAG: alkaline phosphatase family protein [Candidatus Omnitrophota bacterium]